MKLSFEADQNGETIVKVTATDIQGSTVSDEFSVTITPVNDDPEVDLEFEDIVVEEDDPEVIVDLSQAFTDIDIVTNGDELSFVVEVENLIESLETDSENGLSLPGDGLDLVEALPPLLTASIEGAELKLFFEADQNGEATVIVTATDIQGERVRD